ncbi:MAG: four helix bundle protein [Melioribacteraceae bacterium]|nr:four helix bundle protein [Melioribacteraceae bacterium]
MRVFEKNIEYGNPILEKSFRFGVRIVKFYLVRVKKEYHVKDILKQLLRSGTSIGANVAESQESTSKKGFINKLSISLKEARETEYWLKLLKESLLISEKEFISLNNDCDELIRLRVSILRKLKEI